MDFPDKMARLLLMKKEMKFQRDYSHVSCKEEHRTGSKKSFISNLLWYLGNSLLTPIFLFVDISSQHLLNIKDEEEMVHFLSIYYK